jgi:hypothetical protein
MLKALEQSGKSVNKKSKFKNTKRLAQHLYILDI